MIVKTIRKTLDLFPLLNVRVVDGDTVEADIALPFDTNIRKRIRLKGWWADELEGPHAVTGQAAKQRLMFYVSGKALWLFCPAQRLDKYGRIVGDLWHGERIITAQEVLGDLQLTADQHKHRTDEKRRAAAIVARKKAGCCDRCGHFHGGLETCPPDQREWLPMQ